MNVPVVIIMTPSWNDKPKLVRDDRAGGFFLLVNSKKDQRRLKETLKTVHWLFKLVDERIKVKIRFSSFGKEKKKLLKQL